MSLYSAARGLWWVASEVVDAARQLVEFRPGQDDYRAHLADVLAEKEAGAEVAEPRNTCPAGCDCSCCYGYPEKDCHCFVYPCNCGGDECAHGQTKVFSSSAEPRNEYLGPYESLEYLAEPQGDCGLGRPITEINVDYLTNQIKPQRVVAPLTGDETLAVRRLLVESSAAPGVSPVEAADNDPGGHPPTRPPGPLTSGVSDDLIANLREMEAAAAQDIERSITVEGREFNTGYRAALRWVLSLTRSLPEQNATLGLDPASVHDRTMRQRHNEDREQ